MPRASAAAVQSNPLADRRVESLVSFGGRIFAGTDAGLYELGSDGAWSAAGGPIGGREVSALAVSGSWLVAGTESGALRSPDGTTWQAAGLGGEQVDSLSAAGGTVLAGSGTESGGNGVVQRSDDSAGTWTAAPANPVVSGLPGEPVQAVLVPSGGLPAWAGTSGGGALYSADGTRGWTRTSGMRTSDVTAFWRDPATASALLAGSDDGLYAWDGSRWVAVGFPQSDPWVTALATGGDGHPLLGTFTGEVFARGAGGGWTQRASGLSSVYSLLAVAGGGVLVGTDAGVACIDCPSNLAAAASPGPPRSGAASAPPVASRPGTTSAAPPAGGELSPGVSETSPPDGAVGAVPPGASGGSGGGWSLRWWIAGGLVALSALLFGIGRVRTRAARVSRRGD